MDWSSNTSTMHLMPDWLKRLLEDCLEEGGQQKINPIKFIKGESRVAVWNMYDHLGFKSHGLPGQACRLLERYLSIKIFRNNRAFNQEDWEEYQKNLMTKMVLLMATCVQLAAKMSSAGAAIDGTIIRAKLLCKGISFTVDEINASEFDVFSTLGFRIPLWTSVDVAQLLAVEVGVPPDNLETVAATVDYAEFRRDYIEEKVLLTANPSPSTNKSNSIRQLHLSAGAVLAAGRVLHLEVESKLGSRLAILTHAPLAHINCIGDLICTIILANDDDPPLKRPSKRKMPL